MSEYTMTFGYYDWQYIREALLERARELRELENRRTGGNGIGSGGIWRTVESMQRIEGEIRSNLN